MPKCHVCNYEVHPSIGQCPHCGTPVPQPHADLEEQVRGLLDRGQKIEAVKLYRDQTGVGLAKAKEAVEAIQAGAVPPPRSDIGGDLEAELLRLLGRGERLEAIKLYKERMGVALLEAKQAIETLAARHGLETQPAGCLGVVMAVMLTAVALGMMVQ
jgi:large subunit ribosomal protein L7/L12